MRIVVGTRGAYYLHGVGMSPTWAGWDVLYWSLMAGWAALIVLLVVVGTRAACRWWSDRSRRG